MSYRYSNKVLFESFFSSLLYILKFSKKIRPINDSKQTLKSHIKISECPRRVYKGSNKGLDVNIYISNQGVHTLNDELRYVVLKLRKKCSLSD